MLTGMWAGFKVNKQNKPKLNPIKIKIPIWQMPNLAFVGQSTPYSKVPDPNDH